MKIRDIEIGDCFEFSEGRGQISLIYGDTVTIGTYQPNIVELKSISLTMEILGHNGFTVGNYNEWSNPKCDFLHFVIDNSDKNKWSVYTRRV